MGRYSYSNKQNADDLRKIEMSWLKKNGYVYNNNPFQLGGITWTSSYSGKKNSINFSVSTYEEGKKMRIYYTLTDNGTGEQKDINYTVPIVSTPCYFGGVRYWFICSLYKQGVYCGRRVAKLYQGGDYFACRHCYDLTYSSKCVNMRSSWYSSIVVMNTWDRAEKIEKTMKRRFYKGKPTRKMKRLMKLYSRAIPVLKKIR